MITGLAQEIFAAVRSARRRPYSSAIVITVLASALGLDAAVLSLLNGLYRSALPYNQEDRLAVIEGPAADTFLKRNRYRNWDLSPRSEIESSPLFGGIAAATPGTVTVDGAPAQRISAAAVTDAFFGVMGIRPIVGRVFAPADLMQQRQVAVVSEGLWRSLLGGRQDLAGQQIRLNQRVFSVIGVVGADVKFPSSPSVWIPTGIDPQLAGNRPDIITIVRVHGRFDTFAVRDELLRVLSVAFPQFPATWRKATVTGLRRYLESPLSGLASRAAVAAGLILLASCMNVVTVLLVDNLNRRHELGMRVALGASRWRLSRQAMIEGGVVAAGSAALAWPLSLAALAFGIRLLPPQVHVGAFEGLFVNAAIALVVLALVVTACSGLVPLLGNSGRLSPRVPSLRVAIGSGSRRLLRSVVFAQIVATMILLSVSAGLLAQVRAALTLDLGVRGDHAVVAKIDLPRDAFHRPAAVSELVERLQARLHEHPGVDAVGATDYLPGFLPQRHEAMILSVENAGRRPVQSLRLLASPGYPSSIGIDLLAGREFSWADANVVMITPGVAKAFGRRPEELVGARIDLSPAMPEPNWAEIVGVLASDIRAKGRESELQPAVFVPLADHFSADSGVSLQLIVRSELKSHTAAQITKEELEAADRTVPVALSTFGDIRLRQIGGEKVVLNLVVLLTVLGAAEATLGLYALTAFVARVDRRSTAMRAMFGASRRHLLGTVLIPSATLTCGATLLAGAFVAAASQSGVFPTLSPSLPFPAFIAGSFGAAFLMMAAAAIPALAAASVDPWKVLKSE
jgi:predicted permease